ncbi:MAG: DedA family protein [Bdellovibrionales bacterium]|nr:DedA family protein [Bdellovibrionales bacterium]
MPAWMQAYFTAANPMFYPIYGLALLLAGLCMPISADFVLLTAGYLAYIGQAEYALLIPIAIAAILLGDTVMFTIGRRFGRRVIGAWPFRKAFTPERLARTEKSFREQGYRVVFLARFMPGIRTVFMFTSGTLGLRYFRFLAYNFAGALVVIPGTLFAVKAVAGNVELIREKLARGQWIAMAVIVVVGCVVIARKRRANALRASSETR